MPFKPFEIDDSINASASTKPYLAEGYYKLMADGIDVSPEEHAGENYWRWKFRIVAGPSGQGRVFPHTGTWKDTKQFGNGRILNTLGFDARSLQGRKVPDYATFKKLAAVVASKVQGRELGALVGDGEPYNGRPQSEILEFMPLDEYAKRSALAPAAVAARPHAPSANGAQDPGAPASAAVTGVVDDLFGDDGELDV